jgi:hypothetical protein
MLGFQCSLKAHAWGATSPSVDLGAESCRQARKQGKSEKARTRERRRRDRR